MKYGYDISEHLGWHNKQAISESETNTVEAIVTISVGWGNQHLLQLIKREDSRLG
jgi:hypothetical protein